ncbi:hypothetical protein PAPYR_5517 [Paratrimastix pyriformis]|uniref:Uncharacterized protein n=1 Tax=Paratrimastix pyriformis TaxID=342808 RepID=A0ABQ8UN47_9EUKA|nr:hypothetical protein PAPYR_5517 [Paratrimastix pyriformis]
MSRACQTCTTFGALSVVLGEFESFLIHWQVSFWRVTTRQCDRIPWCGLEGADSFWVLPILKAFIFDRVVVVPCFLFRDGPLEFSVNGVLRLESLGTLTSLSAFEAPFSLMRFISAMRPNGCSAITIALTSSTITCGQQCLNVAWCKYAASLAVDCCTVVAHNQCFFPGLSNRLPHPPSPSSLRIIPTAAIWIHRLPTSCEPPHAGPPFLDGTRFAMPAAAAACVPPHARSPSAIWLPTTLTPQLPAQWRLDVMTLNCTMLSHLTAQEQTDAGSLVDGKNDVLGYRSSYHPPVLSLRLLLWRISLFFPKNFIKTLED